MARRVKKSTPTARTNGSANGSLINASSAVVAIARAAATMVAVAPTLDARSQVSFSVRVINSSYIDQLLSRYNEMIPTVCSRAEKEL